MIHRWRKISADFPDHDKTVDLVKLAGEQTILCLIRLWFYMDTKSPSEGIFRGLTDVLIEKKAKWKGEPGALVSALIKSRYACYWKDIEKRGRGGKGYIKRWYQYKHKESPKFEVPDDEDLVFLDWFERNKHLHPDVIAERSERARKNRAGGK